MFILRLFALSISIGMINGKEGMDEYEDYGLILAQWRSMPKRVTAESGSDLFLSCTFHNGDSDETVRDVLLLSFKNFFCCIDRLFNGCIKIERRIMFENSKFIGDLYFSILNH